MQQQQQQQQQPGRVVPLSHEVSQSVVESGRPSMCVIMIEEENRGERDSTATRMC
jgi:hypothetical protein